LAGVFRRYKDLFHFKHKPFELTPDPEFFYLSQIHKKALTYLNYGIKSRVGFIILTGEIGSGKTTIIKTLLKNFHSNIVVSKVANTKVTFEQLLRLINEDFALAVDKTDKVALLRDLNDFLISQYAQGKQCVLIIDEAQNLTIDHLEEIRLLSNLETDKEKLLQIILSGQPELKKLLASPQLNQLRQRIAISFHLSPLTKDDTEAYIRHRISVVGNPERIEFENGAMDLIHRFSRGIPRLINILCDFIFLTAYTEQTHRIHTAMVGEIINELNHNQYWQDFKEPIKPATAQLSAAPQKPDSAAREIFLRLAKLEEVFANQNSLTDFSRLSEKLHDIEKRLTELSGYYKLIPQIVDKISNFQIRLAILEKQALAQQDGDSHVSARFNTPEPQKKKSFWKLLFSKRS
jgi:putative secretion ATPase (PEP-CTERM system associated)